jgi:predicted ribonuclease YlaK
MTFNVKLEMELSAEETRKLIEFLEDDVNEDHILSMVTEILEENPEKEVPA